MKTSVGVPFQHWTPVQEQQKYVILTTEIAQGMVTVMAHTVLEQLAVQNLE
jgi:hypothetical protein